MTSAPSRLRNYQLHHYYKCDTFAAFLVLQPRLKNDRERLSENKNSAEVTSLLAGIKETTDTAA